MSPTNQAIIMLVVGTIFTWWCMCNINLETGTFFPTEEATELIKPLAILDAHEYYQRNIFILAGQSNMAGRGGVKNRTWDGFVPRECEPNRAILQLSEGLTWEEAREPLHADIDSNKTCGIGPGLVFANRVLQKGGGNNNNNFDDEGVGLVPCAAGGTSISEWSRGSLLYNKLIERADVAVKDGGIIRGVLWYQGERDTITREDADSYRTKLEQLILDLRGDLRSPDLLVIEVVIASAQGPWMDVVREAQLGLDLPNVIKVDALGLPLQPDGLHLSTQAQVRLGEMMAGAFLSYKPNDS